MNRLESIVPPLELCKKLKPGEFEDSALVHAMRFYTLGYERVVMLQDSALDRDDIRILAPAPTLDEILEALAKCGVAMLNCSRSDMFGWWECSGCTLTIPQTMIAKHDPDNPAAAALRLWLEVGGVKDEQ